MQKQPCLRKEREIVGKESPYLGTQRMICKITEGLSAIPLLLHAHLMIGNLQGRVFPLSDGSFMVLVPNIINPWPAELWLLSFISEPCVHLRKAESVKSPGTGRFQVVRILKELGFFFKMIPKSTSMLIVGYGLCVAKSKLLVTLLLQNLICLYGEIKDQGIHLSEPGR